MDVLRSMDIFLYPGGTAGLGSHGINGEKPLASLTEAYDYCDDVQLGYDECHVYEMPSPEAAQSARQVIRHLEGGSDHYALLVRGRFLAVFMEGGDGRIRHIDCTNDGASGAGYADAPKLAASAGE